MVKFLILLAGIILGGLFIGGLLFSIFGKGTSGPNISEQTTYTWLGRIIGLIIAAIIASNL